MTTVSLPTIVQYTALASQTVYTFSWAFINTSEIIVYSVPVGNTPTDASSILPTNAYSVSSPSSSGGIVTLVTPSTAGDIITIIRVTPETTVATFNNSNFTPAMLNSSFDNACYMVQDTSSQLTARTPTYNYSAPISDPIDCTLPQLGANQVWAMNSNRTGIVALTIPTGIFTSGTVTSVATGAGLTGGPITTSGTVSVAAGGITPAMMQVQTANRLGGYGSAGAYQAITVSTGLTLSNGILTASGGGSGTVTSVATGAGLTGGPITGSGTISVAAGTANSLAGYGSAGAFSVVTVGSGLALSSGTLTATGGGGGAVALLFSATASNSATIVVTGFTTAYNNYRLVLAGFRPVTTGALKITFNNATGLMGNLYNNNSGGSLVGAFETSVDFVTLNGLGNAGVSQNAGTSLACTANITNMNSTVAGANVSISGETIYNFGQVSSDFYGQCSSAAIVASTQATISFAVGNISIGTVKLYGYN